MSLSPSQLEIVTHTFFPYAPKALITLKKGSNLIKYSRKGRPKIREFRLSSVSSYANFNFLGALLQYRNNIPLMISHYRMKHR
jgi:hypothetical protein